MVKRVLNNPQIEPASKPTGYPTSSAAGLSMGSSITFRVVTRIGAQTRTGRVQSIYQSVVAGRVRGRATVIDSSGQTHDLPIGALLLVDSGFWPSCYGRKGCMAASVERDATLDPDGDAARILDYEPLAICEDCPLASR